MAATSGFYEQVGAQGVIRAAADAFGINPRDVVSSRRLRAMVNARIACSLILRDNVGMSYPEIGRALNRDHTTIMYLCEREGRVHPEKRSEILTRAMSIGEISQ